MEIKDRLKEAAKILEKEDLKVSLVPIEKIDIIIEGHCPEDISKAFDKVIHLLKITEEDGEVFQDSHCGFRLSYELTDEKEA